MPSEGSFHEARLPRPGEVWATDLGTTVTVWCATSTVVAVEGASGRAIFSLGYFLETFSRPRQVVDRVTVRRSYDRLYFTPGNLGTHVGDLVAYDDGAVEFVKVDRADAIARFGMGAEVAG